MGNYWLTSEIGCGGFMYNLCSTQQWKLSLWHPERRLTSWGIIHLQCLLASGLYLVQLDINTFRIKGVKCAWNESHWIRENDCDNVEELFPGGDFHGDVKNLKYAQWHSDKTESLAALNYVFIDKLLLFFTLIKNKWLQTASSEGSWYPKHNLWPKNTPVRRLKHLH